MTRRSLLALNAVLGMLFALVALTAPSAEPATVLINEVDADQSGTDSAEFVELYDGGAGNTESVWHVVGVLRRQWRCVVSGVRS